MENKSTLSEELRSKILSLKDEADRIGALHMSAWIDQDLEKLVNIAVQAASDSSGARVRNPFVYMMV